jgi:hypothetical protein
VLQFIQQLFALLLQRASWMLWHAAGMDVCASCDARAWIVYKTGSPL